MRRESLRIALHGIRANRMRSVLTMLGISIGVGAVIVLVAVGNGSSRSVQQRIEQLGTNTLVVLPQGALGPGGRGQTGAATSSASGLTLADVEALQNRDQVPDVTRVAPVVTASAAGVVDGATSTPQQFIGTTPDYLAVRGFGVDSGSAFTDEDVAEHSRVVLLGQTVVRNLFGTATTDVVGSQVRFGGSTFRVAGVLAAKGSNGNQDQDDIVIAPLTAVQDTLSGYTGKVSTITVQASSRDRMDAAQAEVTAAVLAEHKITDASKADFTVLNQGTLLETSDETSKVFTVLLGAVAAISLLVGGIGVMNIMLVTVTERTHEIGIRKAIGAHRSDILSQFLAEATLLAGIGGILGVLCGLAGSAFKIAGIQPVVAPLSVLLALGVAVAVGLFFGIYPASRAARLTPVAALRHE